ncbi:MAG: SDR family NAD(P)-dependent oxidoreductase [Waterburya sp.]
MTNVNRESRTWLITGCSTGFGRALAQALLEHGARLIATARKPEQLQDLVDRYPQQVSTFALDVTDKNSIHSAVSQAKDAFGRIDMSVNNAGYGTMSAIAN